MPAALRLSLAESMARNAAPGYHVDTDGRGANPRHGLTLAFTPRGASVERTPPLAGVRHDEAGDTLALHLERFGRERLEPVRRATPRIDGARVEYDRGRGVSEWFLNLPQGVEQGWTVAERPGGGGPLVLTLSTGRAPDAAGEGRLTWSGMDYHGLVAIDADGRELSSRWTHDGDVLRIEVDDGGAAYPVVIDPWLQVARLTEAGLPFNTNFGRAAAMSGDTAVIGANFVDMDRGAAYVFVRAAPGNWVEQAKLTADDGMPNDRLAEYVAISEDGDTVVAGAAQRLNDGTGAAYVFTRSDGEWTQQAKLVASGGAADHWFGTVTSLSGDSALIGAGTVNQNVAEAAWVFTRSDGVWSEEAELTASDGETDDFFGSAVALEGDTALIGALGSTTDGSPALGSAYVFTRNGGVWSEQTKLVAAEGGDEDAAGGTVALSGDIAVLGAPLAAVNGQQLNGAAYVFRRSDGVWTEEATLHSPDNAFFLIFGSSVATSDGVVIVGQPGVDLFDVQGRAYVFFDLPPDHATIEGAVRSLGHCGGDTTPIEGATVTLTGAKSAVTLETGENGSYQTFLPASESPLEITATAPGHLPTTIEDIEYEAGDTVVQQVNLILDAPCATAEPESLSVELHPGQTRAETLTVGNVDGGAELSWTISTAEAPAVKAPSAGRQASVQREAGTSGPNAIAQGGDPHLTAGVTLDMVSGPEALPSDGIRPIQPANGVVDCDAEPGIIIHDDGTVENGYAGNPAAVNEAIFADRFAPLTYPAPFTAVCLAFASAGPGSLDFEIVVYDDDGPGASPGTELGALAVTATDLPPAPPEASPTWASFDISSLGITVDSGSVYIGARWAPSDPNVFISADQSPGNPVGFAGGWFWTDASQAWQPIHAVGPFSEYRSLFVRAVANPGGCLDPTTLPWLSVDPTSGTTPAGQSSEVSVSLDAAGLEPDEYRATVCIETDDPVRPLVGVPVVLSVTPAPAALTFDPASLDFGDVDVGTTSAPQTATLHNGGDLAATELAFELAGDGFDADGGACGDSLPGGGSCDVSVTFSPTQPGPADASLEATTAGDAAAALPLSGRAVADLMPTALAVDPSQVVSDGNGVLEPDELVDAAPTWRNDSVTAVSLTGAAADFDGPDGATYNLADDHADYGSIGAGASASCQETGACYRLGVEAPATRPATHWTASFEETLSDGTAKTWTLHIGDSFSDVPRSSLFYAAIETLLGSGVTGGCGAGDAYCPGDANSRAQMPVFMLRALEGAGYTPPACAADNERFGDVPFDSTFCPWIQDLADRGIVSGCGDDDYCPSDAVSRAQMSIFLLKTLEGADYEPPACTNEFTDVPCPSLFADWIEDLAARGITGGCSATEYCPSDAVTRAQMALFITRAFGFTLYGP